MAISPQKTLRKVKLTGERSIESKLMRLAYELEEDAARVRADHPSRDGTADAIKAISRDLGKLGRAIGEDERGAT